MAIKFLNAAWHGEIAQSSTELLVLLALADYADENGWSWPKLNTLANKTMLNERSIRRTLRSLNERGIIQIWDRFFDNMQVGSAYCLVGLGGSQNDQPPFAGKSKIRIADSESDGGTDDPPPPAPESPRESISIESISKDNPPLAESLSGEKETQPIKEEIQPPSFSATAAKKVTDESVPMKTLPMLFSVLAEVYKGYNVKMISKAAQVSLKEQAALYEADSVYRAWLDGKINHMIKDTTGNTRHPPSSKILYSVICGLWWEEWKKMQIELAPPPPSDTPLFADPEDALQYTRFF